MTFGIDLFLPTALPGSAAHVESLGLCKIITKTVFVTVTEHNGEAHVVPLNEIIELDRAQPRYATIVGKTFYPRSVDLPDKIFVEMASGHVRAVAGDQIARLVRSKREVSSGSGRLSW